ncbi:hypothetical protein AAXB25_15185 [Paenibacillus lautus]|uniref:hypothetical protein n=1 Tax=Paenibacillus lautus TaxID=1401 RepID=UPI003D2A8E11
MAEKLLELIEKYEDEIREINRFFEEDHPSEHESIRLAARFNKNQEIIDDLNMLLNSNI